MMLSCIAACAIVSGYVGMKAYESHADEMNKLFMENVEALSSCESNDGYPMDRYCIESMRSYCYYGDFVAPNCISNLV